MSPPVFAKNDMDKFLRNSGVDKENISFNLFFSEDHNPAKHITDYARTEHIDLVIIGSKGRGALAAMLLGSVAEKVCQLENEAAVLVVKNKNENMGFLDALLKL